MPRTCFGDNWRTTISSLPTDLLGKILSNVSTKDSIRTSSVIRGWRNMWSCVPALDLDTHDFQDDDEFWGFFGKYLESRRGQDLERFKLVYNIEEHVHAEFVEWIDAVLKRGVCHMTIQNLLDGEEELVRMPVSIYTSKTLVNMTVFGIVFDFIESGLMSLPCLKTMHLEDVKFDGERLMTTFIARCPVLEELVLVTCHNDVLGVVSVHSWSLKRFTLVSKRGEVFEDLEDDRPNDPDIEVNAPRLEHMVINDYQCENIVVHRIAPYAKVKADVIFIKEDDDPPETSMIRNFFIGILTVEKITMSARTLEMIGACIESGPLPQFANLSRVEISFPESSWIMLQNFLCYCPNLQSLVLEFDTLPMSQIDFSIVPPCFVTSLEFVELTVLSSIKGIFCETRLARYFLRNCTILKELMLNVNFGNIVEKIKRIPKRSASCKIVIC